jgi:hypothetical protein
LKYVSSPKVLEHAIAKVLQAADDHGRSRHRIHFRSTKRAVLSADYWDSARRGSRAGGGVPLSR